MSNITKLVLIRNTIKFSLILLNLFLIWLLFVSPSAVIWIKRHPEASMVVALAVVLIFCLLVIIEAAIGERIEVWREASGRLKNVLVRVEKDVIFYPARAEDCRLLAKNMKSKNFYMAEFIAGQILRRQQNLIDGIPSQLLVYTRTIEEKLGCWDNDNQDVFELKMSIANGDYEVAEILAIQVLSSRQGRNGQH